MMNNMTNFSSKKENVHKISQKLNEPTWLLNKRLEALEVIDKLDLPKIERLDYSTWDLWRIPEVQMTNLMDTAAKVKESNVFISDFNEALLSQEDLFIQAYQKTSFSPFTEMFKAFTTAFLTDSLFVYIPENMYIKTPIELTFTQEDSICNRQVLVYAGANSSVEIIEKYLSTETENKKSANIQIQLYAESGANIQYSSLDQFSKNTTAFFKRAATTEKDATINWALGAMNDGNVIEDVHVRLEGQGSATDVKTVAITHDDQIQGVNVHVTNAGNNTLGNIFQHGVSLDESVLTFNGIGHIIKNAKNSDAQQESRVLMLSDDARADANPILLIDEFEVVAGHAASISRVDQDQLYYLMSRGLGLKQAEKLIIRGFLGIVLSEISVKEVRQELIDTIERKLAQYGS